MSKNEVSLEEVLAKITDKKVMLNFLRDITTPKEFDALQERLNVVCLLNDGFSYSEIAKKTGVSTTTITRVARFFKDEPYGGYRYVVEKILKK